MFFLFFSPQHRLLCHNHSHRTYHIVCDHVPPSHESQTKATYAAVRMCPRFYSAMPHKHEEVWACVRCVMHFLVYLTYKIASLPLRFPHNSRCLTTCLERDKTRRFHAGLMDEFPPLRDLTHYEDWSWDHDLETLMSWEPAKSRAVMLYIWFKTSWRGTIFWH